MNLNDVITEQNEWMQRQLCEAATRTAPGCPDCGVPGAAKRVERREDWLESSTGDAVIWALETYECAAHGRYYRKLELDRETREERDREVDNALARASLRDDLYRRAGVTAMFRRVQRAIEARVQEAYPRRPDPDLLARWNEERGTE